jgi:hypothetical protein
MITLAWVNMNNVAFDFNSNLQKEKKWNRKKNNGVKYKLWYNILIAMNSQVRNYNNFWMSWSLVIWKDRRLIYL